MIGREHAQVIRSIAALGTVSSTVGRFASASAVTAAVDTTTG